MRVSRAADPDSICSVFEDLARRVDGLEFSSPVAHVYNPLRYAREGFFGYLERYAAAPRRGASAKTPRGRSLFLGMNPGPWGMAQTGVPFGTVSNARDWLGLGGARSERPDGEHPKRPVLGFECPREEVSGSRFWGWAQERFGTPESFFASHFVLNYCPLLFLDRGGRNLTPDKLRADERGPLLEACDEAVSRFVEAERPVRIVGIGVFAEQCARRIVEGLGLDTAVGRVLHPSPASPLANRGWAEAATRQLREQGIEVPGP